MKSNFEVVNSEAKNDKLYIVTTNGTIFKLTTSDFVGDVYLYHKTEVFTSISEAYRAGKRYLNK